jgi:hypothetical protein
MVLKVPGSGGTNPVEVLKTHLPQIENEPWIVRTDWKMLKTIN